MLNGAEPPGMQKQAMLMFNYTLQGTLGLCSNIRYIKRCCK